MAFVAACTDKGARKETNEDACCIEVAETPLGEMLMAVVCDGVGGLAGGDLASSTVVDRFADWFEGELPILVEGMADRSALDLDVIEGVWGALLANLNEMIQAYGTRAGIRLGTTFTGILACGGHYIVGHVGDCRAYQMSHSLFSQITQDQTLVAKKLAEGTITQEEAASQPKNVILQSVGTERVLRPVFTRGMYGPDELFVICCDGAYQKAGNEGVRQTFQGVDFRDEEGLVEACRTLLKKDLEHGEKDNLTVLCFSGALRMAGGVSPASEGSGSQRPAMPRTSGPVGVAWAGADEAGDEPMTAVFDDDETGAASASGFHPVSMADAVGDDDLPTTVGGAGTADDDLPTTVENEVSSDEDLPTTVEGGDTSDDDLPTTVEDPTASAGVAPVSLSDRGPSTVPAWPPRSYGAPPFEDGFSTEVGYPFAGGRNEDEIPTEVEGRDA